MAQWNCKLVLWSIDFLRTSGFHAISDDLDNHATLGCPSEATCRAGPEGNLGRIPEDPLAHALAVRLLLETGLDDQRTDRPVSDGDFAGGERPTPLTPASAAGRAGPLCGTGPDRAGEPALPRAGGAAL